MYFFDLDGTLLDSNGIWLDIDIEFLGRHGIRPVPQDYTDYVTHCSFPASAAYTRERFGLSESPEEIVRAWQDMAQEYYAHRLALKPGARAVLEELARRGERLAVVTSCIPKLCRAALDCHGIAGAFEAVFHTVEVGLEKGDPQLYRRLSALCSVPAEECVLFDDSPSYCAAARQAGWQVWGVWDPLFAHREEELRALCGPGRYLSDLSEFLHPMASL